MLIFSDLNYTPYLIDPIYSRYGCTPLHHIVVMFNWLAQQSTFWICIKGLQLQ
jgi:hypothetical protein